MPTWLSVSRPSLALATAIGAAVLGVLALIGGLALLPAVMLAEQPAQQVATAFVLIVVGMVNATASRGLRRRHPRSVLVSAVATAAFMGYPAWVVRDLGEFWWLHATYLVVLLAVHRGGPAAV